MKRLLFVLLLVLGGVMSAQAGPSSPPQGITKEQLQERLVKLEQGKNQAVANANAYGGAIEEVKFWLETLKTQEDAKKAEEAKKPESAKPQGAKK